MLAPRRRRAVLSRGAMIAALLLAAPHAQADEPRPADQTETAAKRAAELKAAADSAMDGFHYAEALAAYEEAYKLAPHPALLYNTGRALQALNRHPEALAKIEAFKVVAPPDVLQKVPDLDKLLADLRAHVGTVQIACNVTGARILVDRTVVGATPLAELKLNAGRRTIDVEAEGYFPFHQVVDVGGADKVSVKATLVPSTDGILVVRASSPGTDVVLDGRAVGVAPAEQVVKAGPHELLLKNPKFADTMASVVVEAGQRKELTVPLRSVPVTSRWWFWTSLGAAAATVAVVSVTAASFVPRGADSGTIAPGRLSAQSFGARLPFHF